MKWVQRLSPKNVTASKRRSFPTPLYIVNLVPLSPTQREDYLCPASVYHSTRVIEIVPMLEFLAKLYVGSIQ
jgi:hypothetical protein